VNAVKPLLTAVVTHTSNITIRLYCRGPFPVVQCRCEYSYRFGRNWHLALLLGSQGCELGFLTDSQCAGLRQVLQLLDSKNYLRISRLLGFTVHKAAITQGHALYMMMQCC